MSELIGLIVLHPLWAIEWCWRRVMCPKNLSIWHDPMSAHEREGE